MLEKYLGHLGWFVEMKWIKTISVLSVGMILSGCSFFGTTADTCEEPDVYEGATGGNRIVAPDDLDNIAAQKELTIPDASPRPARDRSEGCIDKPPTLRYSRDTDEES
mgnify:CR=1 FL=1